jgi:hypothetical protein
MNRGQQMQPEMAVGLLAFICVFAVVALVLYIFYLLTLQRALSRVSPRNRLMEPGHVWLMFVPCLNIVWMFLIAIRVPDSLKNEFQSRGQDDGGDYGKSIGLTYCILSLIGSAVGQVLNVVEETRPIATFASLGISCLNFICLIVFWVKIANYSKRLAEDDEDRYRNFDRRLDDFDDDGDDDDRRGDHPRGSGSADKPSDAIKEGEPGPRPSTPPDEGIKPAEGPGQTPH